MSPAAPAVGGSGDLPTLYLVGGTVSPGNSINDIHINGDLVMSPLPGDPADILFEISPTTTDRINVTGTATLDGIARIVLFPGAYTKETYTILQAQGGLSGTTFDEVTSSLPGFQADLTYTRPKSCWT